MKEFITIPIDQDLLIKILQKAEEKKGSIPDLIQKFFKRIVQEKASLNFNSFFKRQPEQSLDDYLKAIEISEIKEVCYYANSKTDAADKLGLSLRSLRYRLDRYRINFSEDDLKFK
jgi:transcriptional regulator with PAS, ATPase and Fis domain